MKTLLRSAAMLGFAVGLSLPASAAARCTEDRLAVDGTAVAARFCVSGSPSAPSVVETFSASGKSIERTTPLAPVGGARVSRVIDDVDLSPLGLKRSLHMTLAYENGTVALEHALLLPGAIPVK